MRIYFNLVRSWSVFNVSCNSRCQELQIPSMSLFLCPFLTLGFPKNSSLERERVCVLKLFLSKSPFAVGLWSSQMFIRSYCYFPQLPTFFRGGSFSQSVSLKCWPCWPLFSQYVRQNVWRGMQKEEFSSFKTSLWQSLFALENRLFNGEYCGPISQRLPFLSPARAKREFLSKVGGVLRSKL